MHLRRSVIVSLVAAAAFAGGLASSRLLERDAKAQQAPLASTIFVPADGLAFRTFDGRVVARLSYDDHGGVLELYDEHERSGARVRGVELSTHGQGASRIQAPDANSQCNPPYSIDSLGREIFKPECL